MSDRPARVSVVIPTYQYAAFLPDAIASLREQTLEDWEGIVVDDGSTDETSAVLEGIAADDPRIRSVRQPTGGVSAARNAGLALARAPFVQFLDADDRLEPNKLDAHVGFLETHPEVDLVYGEAAAFGDVGWEVSATALGATPGTGAEVLTALLRRNALVIAAPVVRRDAILRIGGFADERRLLEDWDVWVRIAAAGAHFAHHAPPGSRALIRLHRASASRDRARMLEATVSVRCGFESLRLPATLRRINRRALTRAATRLALAEIEAGRIGAGLRAGGTAVRALIGSFA
jgi:glycosyltransferase involved in cell wall biosynthesis